MVTIRLIDAERTRLDIAKQGYTLRSFSSIIGVSSAYLSQILTQKNNPSPKIAMKIAHGLNKDIEDIFLINAVD